MPPCRWIDVLHNSFVLHLVIDVKSSFDKFLLNLISGLAQKLESLDTIRDMTRKNSDSDETESHGSMR